MRTFLFCFGVHIVTSLLAQDLADIVGSRYGLVANSDGTSASTDFVCFVPVHLYNGWLISFNRFQGNVSYGMPFFLTWIRIEVKPLVVLPALHPAYGESRGHAEHQLGGRWI